MLRFPAATVLFSDLVDFTGLSATLAPEETVKLLGLLFSQFDDLAVRCGLETIKTIGDGYMATSGILERRPDGAIAVAEMGLSMLEITEAAGRAFDGRLQLRIGIHTGGPMVAGVLGTHKVAFDVWGDAVNTAKRMETYGMPSRVHVSAATRQVLGDAFRLERRGGLDVKGKGVMETYFIYRQWGGANPTRLRAAVWIGSPSVWWSRIADRNAKAQVSLFWPLPTSAPGT